jgi:hypothetical protein
LVYDQASDSWIPGAAGATAAGNADEIQYNDGASGLAASPDLTWDDTGKVLEVGGDINLDDGGANTLTLQTVTPTAARTISFPDATGTVGLVAGSSGNLVVNQSGAYAGVANSSVDNATGNITLGSRFISSLNGAASAPPGTFTGTWFTGGTSTTTKPQLLIEPTGATSTAWSTSGTGLGVNAASGFAGNLLDLQVNGTRALRVLSSGAVLSAGGYFNETATSTGISISDAGGNPQIEFLTSATARARITGALFQLTGPLVLSSGDWGNSTNVGVFLARDAANTLAQRNGTNAQTTRVYGTYTNDSNYVRAALSSTSTAVTLAAETAGTGADDIPLNLTAAGTGTVKVNSNLEIADAKDIVLATGTGTKIGTATTQRLGFYNATPVVQPTAVADATSGAEAVTQLNALLSRMRDLGLIAT